MLLAHDVWNWKIITSNDKDPSIKLTTYFIGWGETCGWKECYGTTLSSSKREISIEIHIWARS